MMTGDRQQQPIPSTTARTPPANRWLTLAGIGALGIGLVGFLVGIADPVVATRSDSLKKAATPAGESQRSPAAPTYSQIDAAVHGANKAWSSELEKLKQSPPKLFAPVVRTAAMKDEALRDRARTRAFDGAPPAIPHAIVQQSAESCLACHGQGMVLAGRVATKMSHPLLSNCTQCHVEQTASVPVPKLSNKPAAYSTATPVANASTANAPSTSDAEAPWPPGNTFMGVMRAGPGIRLMPGAPPSIPHTLHMRSDCLSCHGLVARAGIRTTHPWLQNCVQCHAAPADRCGHPAAFDE